MVSKLTAKIPAVEVSDNDQDRIACLVAAILATSVLEADAPSPDKIFKVYGNIVRMIETQPYIF
jgi:hypothetical protein